MQFSHSVAITWFWGAAAGWFITAPSHGYTTTSFVPQKLKTTSFLQQTPISIISNGRNSKLKMFTEPSGGMEQLNELLEQSDQKAPLAKHVRKSPSLFKLAGLATIPVGAVLGFGIVPSRRIAAHAVGALVTGIAGAVGKSRLDALTEESAKPALAQAIVDHGLENVETTRAAVLTVQENFGLDDEDFETLAIDIYSQYLLGMVKYNPQAKTVEIKELQKLKQVLNLNNLGMGEAHAAAAQEWYRATTLFTSTEDLDDPDHPDRQAMDKLLFLTERALRASKETEQAFLYEMTRVAKAVGLSYSESLERVAEIAEPFYRRALQSTRSKLGSNQVSSDMLERARQTLGISQETAFDMHVAAFNSEVKVCLGLPEQGSNEEDEDGKEAGIENTKIKFAEGSKEKLEQLREILGLSDEDAAYEIALEASPFFQATALDAVKDVLTKAKNPDQAWAIVDRRREELLMKESSSKDLISSIVMQALGSTLEQANKFAKVNNEAATYDQLIDALESKKALLAILEKSGWNEFDNFNDKFCNPWDKKSANGFLSTDERVKLYRIFLTRSVRKASISNDDIFARVKEIQGLLGITDQQAEIEIRVGFGPELKKALSRATTEIASDFTPELVENMRKSIMGVLESYRLSVDFLRECGASFYGQAVEIISDKSPSGIPTREQQAALDSLREIFMLKKEETYSAHMEYFGSVYKKSVLEAMGQTGIIRREYRESLDDLRQRLGVAEEDSYALFLDAVEEKMKPMVQWIGSEMERTMLSQEQLSRRRGKDMGEDIFQSGKGANGVLGLGAEVNIMRDIMELIDFYKENDIIDEEPADEEGNVRKAYPVTALGTGSIDQEMAELLYRQFIVSSFTSQGPNASRYEEERETFSGILGLDQSKIDEINNNIASTVYDNFVTNAMKAKGSLDQQDMMFLATIQSKLGLAAEQGEKMLLQSQKKILSEEINELMDSPTPEGLRAFREKCNSMGMNLQDDVGISLPRLTRMFETEVTPALKSGEINAENAEVLIDIQESLGIDPEECESMFEALLLRLSKSAMSLISGELLRGREDNAVELIKEISRYAAFTGGDIGLEVDEPMAHQIMNIYDALDMSDEDPERVQAKRELLRAAVGLSS